MVQYCPIVVHDRPFCVWDHDIAARNAEFLESIDSLHFSYLADTHGPSLECDHRQRAAIELRKAYSHGLETLFAFIGALLQAPGAMYAWILQYRERDLQAVVAAIQNSASLRNRYGLALLSWDAVSRVVIPLSDREGAPEVIAAFAKLWQRFATDYLMESFHREYNGIKHGFRCKAGGFSLSIMSAEPGNDTEHPSKGMSFTGSEFGTTIFVTERLSQAEPQHIRVKTECQNWMPQNYISALHLISTSIQNILTIARIRNGADPSNLEFVYPADLTEFDSPWRLHPQITNFSMNSRLIFDDINPLNKNEILALYESRSSQATGQAS